MLNDTTKEIIITRVGLHAQWCDSGRQYCQKEGYSQSGALDWFSYQLSNAVCGMPLNSPSIEVMGGLFSFKVSHDCLISIAGASADISVNNRRMVLNQLIYLQSGDELKIGQLEKGLFIYVSFAATFKLPIFRNSVCAVKRERVGGLQGDGTGLKFGQRIAFANSMAVDHAKLRNKIGMGSESKLFAPLIYSLIRQQFSTNKQLPVIFSYQHASFSRIEKRRLIAHSYKVSTKLDKMGVRLEGPKINTQSTVLTSQAMANGAIQIPGDGKPIIMRNDRQTIGGYPVIGVVNRVGLALLSQSCAHERISFVPTNIESSIISKHFIDLQLNRVLNKTLEFLKI